MQTATSKLTQKYQTTIPAPVRKLLHLQAGDAVAFNIHVGQSVLAMITSAANSSWPLDVEISDLDSAGLTSASIVRMKLFTLDHQLILRKIGMLSAADRQQVHQAVQALLGA